MSMPASRRRWTAADVRALADASHAWPRYELIDGELVVTPAPGFTHQLCVGELFRALYDYLEREPVGMVMLSPADLELETGTITQPDLFVVPVRVVPAGAHIEWPDIKRLLLAIEVLSPGSAHVDRVAKRDFYLRAGVPDYLVVDVDRARVEWSSPVRRAPDAFRTELVWHPAGASQPLVLNLPALFQRVSDKAGAIGGG